MRKKEKGFVKLLSLIFISILFLLSCSEDNGSTGPSNVDEFYLSHFFRNNILDAECLYNDDNTIQRINDYDEGELGMYELCYYDNGKLSKIERYWDSDILEDWSVFYYDNDLLVEIKRYEDPNEPYASWKFDYEDSKMTRWSIYYDNPNFEIFSGYYDFVYENDNLTNVKRYNSDEELISEYTYEYDTKNNAFYYVNTMRYLWDDDYPFIGNHNIVSCIYDYFDEDDNTWYQRTYSFSYVYNDSDFPTSCVRVVTYNGGSYTDSYSYGYIIEGK